MILSRFVGRSVYWKCHECDCKDIHILSFLLGLSSSISECSILQHAREQGKLFMSCFLFFFYMYKYSFVLYNAAKNEWNLLVYHNILSYLKFFFSFFLFNNFKRYSYVFVNQFFLKVISTGASLNSVKWRLVQKVDK